MLFCAFEILAEFPAPLKFIDSLLSMTFNMEGYVVLGIYEAPVAGLWLTTVLILELNWVYELGVTYSLMCMLPMGDPVNAITLIFDWSSESIFSYCSEEWFLLTDLIILLRPFGDYKGWELQYWSIFWTFCYNFTLLN